MKRFLLLNIKFNKNGDVECAKSKSLCRNCPWGKDCEEIKCFYDPFEDIDYCRKNDYRKR